MAPQIWQCWRLVPVYQRKSITSTNPIQVIAVGVLPLEYAVTSREVQLTIIQGDCAGMATFFFLNTSSAFYF